MWRALAPAKPASRSRLILQFQRSGRRCARGAFLRSLATTHWCPAGARSYRSKNPPAADADDGITLSNRKEMRMSVASFRAGPQEQSRLHRMLVRIKDDPAYQAFVTLRVGFAIVPIAMGVDKFFNNFVDWERYLAHWIDNASPLSAVHTMHVVGVIEIVAGVLVGLKPRYFAYLVAAWLGGIVINLLTYSGYYDIAIRDAALMLAALTLGRLASRFDPPGLRPSWRD